MYLPGSGDGVDAVMPPPPPPPPPAARDPCPFFFFFCFFFLPSPLFFPFPFAARRAGDSHTSLRCEASLKLLRSPGAEVVAASDDVGSVGVVGWIEGGEEGEHFGCVAAAAEDDEEVRWGAAFARGGRAAVEGGEDVD